MQDEPGDKGVRLIAQGDFQELPGLCHLGSNGWRQLLLSGQKEVGEVEVGMNKGKRRRADPPPGSGKGAHLRTKALLP